MKKVLSVILCVAMLCSCICLFAFADATEPAATYTYSFYDEILNDDGTTVRVLIVSVQAAAGEVPQGPAYPSRPHVDGGAEWEFGGWKCDQDNKTYWNDTLPGATQDLTLVASYKKMHDNTDEGDITLLTFISSIFARLNKIFKTLSQYFEDLTTSVSNMLK